MKFLLAFLAVMLVAMPALAAEKPMQKMDHETFFKMNKLHGPAFNSRAVFEGFEDNTMPPAGWTVGITVPENTWGTTDNPLEGAYCAFVQWQSALLQDETMSFDQLIDVAGEEYILSFFMAGSVGSSWQYSVAETVEVNGVTVFDFDSNATENFVYEQFFVDLSAYDGMTVTITFRYNGIDGDTHYVDAVMVDDGTGYEPPPPPPGPDNDTCQGAEDEGFWIDPGSFVFVTDNSQSYHDYTLTYPSCSGWGFTGLDLVWVVCMEEGDTLNVTMASQPAWDGVLFLITDCEDPQGSCVIGSDATVDEGIEHIFYTAEADGVYYLISGGYSASESGPYMLQGQVTGVGCEAVGTEDTSWGGLKSLYR